MKKDAFRKIPGKNYLILGIIFLITVFLLYYFYMWSQAYKETKLNIRIMDSYMEVINYNELEDYLVENPDTVIYVSVLEDSKIREFEKKFKTVLKNNELDNEILYMDITENIKKQEIQKLFNNYNQNGINFSKLPFIIVMQEGIIKDVYSISDNDYDVINVKTFINNVNFNNGDDVDG